MRRPALALLLLAACRGPGYRTPEESEPMRLAIEDRNIATRVRMALAADPVTARYRSVRVSCESGEVTLTGEVDRMDARRRAVDLAEACRGVRAVIDLIRVSSG